MKHENINNHQTHGSHLDETSVFANRFIPSEFKVVNLREPTTFLQTGGRLDDSLQKDISQRWVDCMPQFGCLCQRDLKHHFQPPILEPLHTDYRRFALISNNRSHPHRASAEFNDRTCSNLAEYVKTFKALLQEEFEEILHLYERYSLYNTQLSYYKKGETYYTATIRHAGLADLKPPLQPGDDVLIRPICQVYLPPEALPHNFHDPNIPMHNPSLHLPEIQCQVVNTKAQSPTTSPRKGHHDRREDSVTITWLPIKLQEYMSNVVFQKWSKGDWPPLNFRFVPSSKQYRRELTALSWLGQLPDKIFQHVLFPDQVPILQKLESNNGNGLRQDVELNKQQQEFVQLVITRSMHPSLDKVRPPVILTGPAGTGKTKTLLAALMEVLNLSPKNRILVCAPSHNAADVVTKRLIHCGLTTEDLFRLYDADRPVETVPVDLIAYCAQNANTGAFTLPSSTKLLSYRVIVCTCSDASILYQVGVTNQHLRERRQCFKGSTETIINACRLSGSVNGVDDPVWTHLFIDEAAQATEPETLVPFSVVVDPQMATPKVEIALVGDPRQLSPNIYAKQAAENGLGRSMIERLLQRPVSAGAMVNGGQSNMLGHNLESIDDILRYSFWASCGRQMLSVFLTMNYRGHPGFLMMPSCLFYHDKLQSYKGVEHDIFYSKLQIVEATAKPVVIPNVSPVFAPRKTNFPIHFRSVIGHDACESVNSSNATNSWFNRAEADAVLEIVLTLAKNRVHTQDIGVMCAFRGQVALIRNKLRQNNLGGVNVGLVEFYQAVERPVIVLSLTRSNPQFVDHDVAQRMGLFRQQKRANVAMTRGENLFIVVGNPIIMAADPLWRQYLGFCLRNGLWYGDSGGRQVEEKFSNKKEYKIVRHLGGEINGKFLSSKESSTGKEENLVCISTLEQLCTDRE